VAVGAWLAAAFGTLLSARLALECAAVAAVVTTFARHGPLAVRVLAALAVGVVLAGASAAWHVHRLTSGAVPRLALGHDDVELVLRLVRDPTPSAASPGLTITDATVTAIDAGQWHSVDSPVLVLSYAAGWTGLLPGQRLTVDGRLSPPRSGDDVAAVFDARGSPTLIGHPAWWQQAAGRVRAALRQAASRLPADERGLLPSLVDGDESAVPADLQTDMRATGLTHLEAVSGVNVRHAHRWLRGIPEGDTR
jgi:competence protein ComEC